MSDGRVIIAPTGALVAPDGPQDATAPVLIGDLELAVEARLRADLPAWLDHFGVVNPKGWVQTSEFVKHAEDQLPVVSVSCPGTDGNSFRDGDGNYVVGYVIETGALVSASTERATRALMHAYAASIRQVMGSGGGFSLPVAASPVRFRSESFAEVAVIDRRTIIGCLSTWWLMVDPTAMLGPGPPPLGTVTEVCGVDVELVQEVS